MLMASLSPVRHDAVSMAAQGLDVGEDVVPSTTIESSRVLSELVQDLVHLKSCWQGLNQHCGLQQGQACITIREKHSLGFTIAKR